MKTVKNTNSHKPFALYPADFTVIGKVIPDRSEKRNINGTLIVIKFFINITSFRFIIKVSYLEQEKIKVVINIIIIFFILFSFPENSIF